MGCWAPDRSFSWSSQRPSKAADRVEGYHLLQAAVPEPVDPAALEVPPGRFQVAGILDVADAVRLAHLLVDLALVVRLDRGHELAEIVEELPVLDRHADHRGAARQPAAGDALARQLLPALAARLDAHRHAGHQLEMVEVAVPRPLEGVLAGGVRGGAHPVHLLGLRAAELPHAEVGTARLEGDAHVGQRLALGVGDGAGDLDALTLGIAGRGGRSRSGEEAQQHDERRPGTRAEKRSGLYFHRNITGSGN